VPGLKFLYGVCSVRLLSKDVLYEFQEGQLHNLKETNARKRKKLEDNKETALKSFELGDA